MSNDYGINNPSLNRKNIKCPPSITISIKGIDEVKHLKKKYQEVKEALFEKK